MKHVVAVVCILVSALVLTEAARARREDTYTTRFDNINVDEILASDRLVDNYVKCLLDKGRCTAEGAELKSHISDALQTGCTKCSDKQRAAADKIVKFMIKNKPEEWEQLKQKYDPDGTFSKKYEKELKEISA